MTLQELEETIAELSAEELAQFRDWFLEFDAQRWDRRIEWDVASGLLDRLADDAVRQHRAGESSEL